MKGYDKISSRNIENVIMNIMKMYHILSEFTPSSEEHNYLLPVPNDFKIIGHYTVSREKLII